MASRLLLKRFQAPANVNVCPREGCSEWSCVLAFIVLVCMFTVK